MGMVVRTNTMSSNAYRQLGMNNTQLSKSLEKLSSGYRINRAGDDASGLAISEKMKAQISGLEQASANSQDGISLVQTAEGALTEVHSMLNRMVELATKSSSGTIQNDVDRDAIQSEVNALKDEISRVAKSTDFNGINLLNGSLGGWNGTNTAATGIATNAITVSGGQLNGADTIKIKSAQTTGAISLEEIKLADTTGITAFDGTAGITATVLSNPDANAAGTTTIKLTVTDKSKLTASVADAIGDGLTITVKTTAIDTSADAESTFTAGGVAGALATGGGLTLQVGTTDSDYNKVTVNVGDMSAKGLGIDNLDVSSAASAASSIDTIKAAINKVSTTRGNLGALQNRLEHAINNLDTTAENMSAANSAIRDTDMAKEMMNYTKNNILSQAAQAMLAQANQQPQNILQLLK